MLIEGGIIAIVVAVIGIVIRKTGLQEKIGDLAEKGGFYIGAGITIALNKVLFGIWDKVFEPVIETTLLRFVQAFLRGLNSDEVERVTKIR